MGGSKGFYKHIGGNTYIRPSRSSPLGVALDHYVEVDAGDTWALVKITHLEGKARIDLKDSIALDKIDV